MSSRFYLRGFAAALLAAGLGYCSLGYAASPDPLSLDQLTRKAGFIFAGRVLRMERPVPLPGRVPLVRLTLRVERALRGVRAGQTFTFDQWAGSWDHGPQYHPGQRLLLFLYPRGPAGLTSVVGGRLGQFDVDPGGNIVLRADQQRIFSAGGDERLPRADERLPAKLRYRDFAIRVRRTVQE